MERPKYFKFRLYVAGDTLNSMQAIANLKELCRVYLRNRHQIEVVDVFREPKRALADRILMTPTLIKLSPAPAQRVVGTLSQTQNVVMALGLEAVPARAGKVGSRRGVSAPGDGAGLR